LHFALVDASERVKQGHSHRIQVSGAQPPQQSNDFPSFAPRICRLRLHLFNKHKVSAEQRIQFLSRRSEWGASTLRRLARIPWVQKEYCEQRPFSGQSALNRSDIVRPSRRIDCAKAGVLKNPIKSIRQFYRQIANIRQSVLLISSERRSARFIKSGLGNIQTNNRCLG
jgi:hypothetical protein